MADTKIKDTTNKAVVAGTDQIPINDVAGGNLDKMIVVSGISTYVKSDTTATFTNIMPIPIIPIIDAGVTSYTCPYSNADFALEANTGILITQSCTLTELKTTVLTNGITDNTVITVRKNGSNTTSTVTYGSGVTTAQNDTTHTVSFVSGDILTISIVGGATGTTITGLQISLSMRYSVSIA